MIPVPQQNRYRKLFVAGTLVFSFLVTAPNLFSQTTNSTPFNQNAVLASLRQKSAALKSLTATVRIGIPHPQANVIQWTDAFVAWQQQPEQLYVKGYKPLVPLYFLLESHGGAFRFFITRSYTVYQGKNEVFEREIDIDLKLIPQDIRRALTFPDIGADKNVERILTNGITPNEVNVLTIKYPNGNTIRQITVDLAGNPVKTVEYNEAGFPSVEISRNNWKKIGGMSYPFQIKSKRLLPRPNEIFLELKEIRLNTAAGPNLDATKFPTDAKIVELG